MQNEHHAICLEAMQHVSVRSALDMMATYLATSNSQRDRGLQGHWWFEQSFWLRCLQADQSQNFFYHLEVHKTCIAMMRCAETIVADG